MGKIARIPITNLYTGADYTGQVRLGPQALPVNLILDTGSSALAVNASAFQPNPSAGDKATNLAQLASYGEGASWTGAVVTTELAVGDGTSALVLPAANVAVAYETTPNMFAAADGILGLAYAPLDAAYGMPEPTWPKRYTSDQVLEGTPTSLVPYMTQLNALGVASDVFAFYALRSLSRVGHGAASDPMNGGQLIVGGGVECTDLFTGSFQVARVVADDWYNTNLLAIRVGAGAPLMVPPRGPLGQPSNSIIDSGTNSLNLGPQLLKALLAKFEAAQRALLQSAIFDGQSVSTSALDLATWPDLFFTVQGDGSDVTLAVAPRNYWQLDTQQLGTASVAITVGADGLSILGLPLMNGYFTVFDGSADNGRGVVRFASIRLPANTG